MSPLLPFPALPLLWCFNLLLDVRTLFNTNPEALFHGRIAQMQLRWAARQENAQNQKITFHNVQAPEFVATLFEYGLGLGLGSGLGWVGLSLRLGLGLW